MSKILLLGTLLLLAMGCAGQEAEKKALVEVAPENPFSGDEVSVKAIFLGYGVEEIVVQLGNEKKSFLCPDRQDCSQTFLFTPSAGVHVLKVTGRGEEALSESRRIAVLERKQDKCLNGILFGECSTEKPLYCDNGEVRSNCGKCGCENGEFCSGSVCRAIAGKLAISKIVFPAVVPLGKKFSVKAELVALEKIFGGAQYAIGLGIGKKKLETTATAPETPKDGIISAGFDGILLGVGIYDVNVSVFALNLEKEALGNYSSNGAIRVALDTVAPEAPEITGVFAEGDDAVITWSGADDTSEYRLYASIEANPAFISYKFAKSFPGNTGSGVLEALSPGTHFFVMTAVDEAGNESKYSNVESARTG